MSFEKWHKVLDLILKTLISLASAFVAIFLGLAATRIDQSNTEAKWILVFSDNINKIVEDSGSPNIVYVTMAEHAIENFDPKRRPEYRVLLTAITEKKSPDETTLVDIETKRTQVVESLYETTQAETQRNIPYFAVVASFTVNRRDLAEKYLENFNYMISRDRGEGSSQLVVSMYKTEKSNNWALVIEERPGCGSSSQRANEIVQLARRDIDGDAWASDAFRQIDRNWRFVKTANGEMSRCSDNIPLLNDR